MRKHVLPALTVAGLLALSPAVAFAGGSDSPTPYDVTEAGVTLPDGETFLAHGHVNVRIDGVGYGIHFDPNNGHPGGAWIGQSFIPWTAFGVDTGCTEWVQIHGFNEHFGEGAQDPVCFGNETPEPKPSPEPEPEPEPEEPGEETPEAPEAPGVDVPEADDPDVPATTNPVVTEETTTSGNHVETAAVPVVVQPRTAG